MKNFDTFIGIDWSGAKSPIHTKSIAVAKCTRGNNAPDLLRNKWSRKKIFEYIQALKGRTLIGIDANFGYAQEIGIKQLGNRYNYNDLWCAVEKKSAQEDNFFASGFWEAYPEYFWTHGKMPPNMQFPKRQTETLCAAQGYGNPESPFKLIGAKQVGKGGLSAMRMAYALKREMGDQVCIWPFEHSIANTAKTVITEIFPRQFLMRSGHGRTKVKTQEALNAALKTLGCKNRYETNWFSDHDSDAIVSAAGLRMLCGNENDIPNIIADPPQMNTAARTREGWVFGV